MLYSYLFFVPKYCLTIIPITIFLQNGISDLSCQSEGRLCKISSLYDDDKFYQNDDF